MRRRASPNNEEKQTLLKKTTMTEQDYDDINAATAGAPVSVQTATFARSPPVTLSLYEEVHSMLLLSRFVYDFTRLLIHLRHKDLDINKLKVPEKFCCKDLGRFVEDSIDLTEFNGTNGISFSELRSIVDLNKDALLKEFAGKSDKFNRDVIAFLLKEHPLPDGTDYKDHLFLIFHRSVRQKKTCVYSVIKDTKFKTVIVSFRGSSMPSKRTHDWRTNITAFAEKIKTPKKVRDKMKVKFQVNLLVHRGFFRYLFDNRHIAGKQRYDEIINDVETAIGGEVGYRVNVTGHSPGGALASVFAFKLAGAGKKRDTIPRPITLITFAAPFSGTAAYRTAFENMERDGLIRSVRVSNNNDWIPAIPPFSFPSFSHILPHFYKHVGINIRLTSSECSIQHSTLANFKTVLLNSIFFGWKNPLTLLKAHNLELYHERIENSAVKERLEKETLDDLYKDETVVSKNFLDGKAL